MTPRTIVLAVLWALAEQRHGNIPLRVIVNARHGLTLVHG